jgi:hypothetical protein
MSIYQSDNSLPALIWDILECSVPNIDSEIWMRKESSDLWPEGKFYLYLFQLCTNTNQNIYELLKQIVILSINYLPCMLRRSVRFNRRVPPNNASSAPTFANINKRKEKDDKYSINFNTNIAW